ncbi:MAG: hypothetical protein QNK16_01405 [Woeseiaceae bacterium]|nr:hypothetical protein [Woeseiaceae bacterium]MDX2607012.1 hypothetical protein [Woeseiaceae bacterium]
MNKPREPSRPWRVFWLIPVAVLATLSIIATGGSGGGNGNDDDDVEPPLVILPNYNFFLGNLNDGAPLTVVVGDSFTVSVDIDGLLAGNLDLNVGAGDTVTFLSYLIRTGAGISITVTSPEGSPLDGTFSVNVTSDIVAAVGEPPTSGAFTVVPGPPVGATVTILADGVQLEFLGETFDYTWDEFTDLLDDELAATWQRHASLAGGALEFIIEQFFNVADVLDELEAITFNNPFVETCDMFTGAPPDGVLAQGEITVTWLGSGELSDGDDFTWQFTQCWDADDEELIDGTITLQDYTESVDFNTGVLFDIGFGGLGANAPGGVIFDFTISETVEDQGIWTIPADGVITVSGGFVLNIQQP